MEDDDKKVEEIEETNNNINDKKEKKGKKWKKKQRKEEERKRKEEEVKLKEEKEKNKNEDENKVDNGNNKENDKVDDNDKNEKEEFIIDTSIKKLKEEEEQDNKNEIKISNSEEDKIENSSDNNSKIGDENNDNIQKIIKKLKKARRGSICQELNIKEDECNYVIDKSYEILQKEDSLLKIEAPLYICGDIHGQYYDLLRVFDILNYPPQSTFLFLGDYVDRGKQSLECLLLLLSLKIKYPDKIFLLRGNHECEALNKIYGFFDECKRRLSIKCFKKITNLFNIMPISALINENILCMHGGLSKDLQNIEQINKILRPTDIPNECLLCDILWSDPNESLNEDFGSNERNISVTFSKDVVKNFLEKNNLDLICRAHQVVEEGFEFFADMKLVTIFTAPNYMGEFDNNGGILEVGEDLLCKFHVLRPNFERNGKRRRITKLVN
jgi:serine/threonine-protein phosphatase PP1 catalytic subunit